MKVSVAARISQSAVFNETPSKKARRGPRGARGSAALRHTGLPSSVRTAAGPLRPRDGGRASPSPLRGRHQVGEEAIGPRDTRGELSEERESGVDEGPIAVPRYEERSLRLLLARVGHREERLVPLVPASREVEPSLLDPALEVPWTDSVRDGKQRVVRVERTNRSLFDGDAVARKLQREGARVRRDELLAGVVLDDVRPAVLHVIEEPGLDGGEAFPRVVGAHARHDGIVASERRGGQLLVREEGHFETELAQGLGDLVTRSHDVSDPFGADEGVPPDEPRLRGRREGDRWDVWVVDPDDVVREGRSVHGRFGPDRAGRGARR